MFLQLVHDAPVSGNLGRDRTLERVRQTVYWPSVTNMWTIIVLAVLNVNYENVPNTPCGHHCKVLQGTEIPAMPLLKISCDFVGLYPETPDGYKYVL